MKAGVFMNNKSKVNVIKEMKNLIPDLELEPIPVSTTRTVEEWVIVAEKLAKENDGILPIGNWLINNGYGGLHSCMRKYPEPFKDIPQDNRKQKTLKEWVIIAEKLAKENDGIFPSRTWIRRNGYSGLSRMMLKHPEKFSHINQRKRITRILKEWIPIAEKLAKENGGILPSYAWLKKNKYTGLCEFIRKYPESFSHIKQDKRVKNLEEWIQIAERLAKENNGILPSQTFLTGNGNGYTGLARMMRKHPEKFKHIKQNRIA